MDTLHPTKKLRIGWFTFSCCEDSTVVMSEVMNDHWQEWQKLLNIRHARVLQSKNILDQMDVAFVEGALASEDHIKKLKEIRKLATKLVAVGACACIGMPSGQRNQFPDHTKEEIEFILARFQHLPKVMKLEDAVIVDAKLPGCPMDPKQFEKLIGEMLKEFRII